jgi:hypothetical protein
MAISIQGRSVGKSTTTRDVNKGRHVRVTTAFNRMFGPAGDHRHCARQL